MKSRTDIGIPVIKMKGIYVLIIELDRPVIVPVGRNRKTGFQPGFYGYVGSALAGLEPRLRRHLRTVKKMHWHIDYLLNVARIQDVLYACTAEKKECAVARAMSYSLVSVPRFGCSDCKCASHLFFYRDRDELEDAAFRVLKNSGLVPLSGLSGFLEKSA